MNLNVIAGHGAGDPGACGNGYTEAERVRALASAIKERGGSSVTLLDTSRNWYADNGVSSLSIPKGDALIELHMDSATASAKGGHVIIKAGIGGADQYDKALAASIASIFPGRAQSIVERSDLANPNRAYARGINYRLLECGFITNSGDVQTFNSRMGEIADAILAAFGIGSTGASTPAPEPARVSIERVDHAVYRLRNDGNGDHLFTPNHAEAETIAALGWVYEGVAWKYADEGDEVCRLYNPANGLHFLTANHTEHDSLVKAGWVCEGETFCSGTGADVYRLYNHNNGAHHFTTDANERDTLARAGWTSEGVAFKTM